MYVQVLALEQEEQGRPSTHILLVVGGCVVAPKVAQMKACLYFFWDEI